MVPKGRDIRPTSDKIRGAVFNMLASRGGVDGVRVLDAYCGSGALGLEALSRGAAHVTFFDKSRESLSLARDNASMLCDEEGCRFDVRDSSKLPPFQGEEAYNLIFLDPPYHKGLIDLSLISLCQGGWLAPEAWIVCESERSAELSLPSNVVLVHEKIYGEIKISLLQYQPIMPE